MILTNEQRDLQRLKARKQDSGRVGAETRWRAPLKAARAWGYVPPPLAGCKVTFASTSIPPRLGCITTFAKLITLSQEYHMNNHQTVCTRPLLCRVTGGLIGGCGSPPPRDAENCSSSSRTLACSTNDLANLASGSAGVTDYSVHVRVRPITS